MKIWSSPEECGGRIYGNGLAFATKFLYFAHGSKTSPRCVILDEVVAGKLRDLGVWPKAATAAWFPSTYASYCELMTSGQSKPRIEWVVTSLQTRSSPRSSTVDATQSTQSG